MRASKKNESSNASETHRSMGRLKTKNKSKSSDQWDQ